MQPRIWICTQQPDETALRKAANIGLPTDTEYRRCSALLVQPLP